MVVEAKSAAAFEAHLRFHEFLVYTLAQIRCYLWWEKDTMNPMALNFHLADIWAHCFVVTSWGVPAEKYNN